MTLYFARLHNTAAHQLKDTVVLRTQPLQLEPVLKHILTGLNTSHLTEKNQNMYKRVSRSESIHIKHTGQDSVK